MVGVVGFLFCDEVDDVKSFGYLSEDGVFAIECRRAADGGICFDLGVGEGGGGECLVDLSRDVVVDAVECFLVVCDACLEELLGEGFEELLFEFLPLHFGEVFGEAFEFSFAEFLSLHDVELASAALLVGVYLVSFACRRECSLDVEVLFGEEFGGDGVSDVARAPEFAFGVGVLGVGVAALNHESLDDAVEEGVVEKLLVDEFEEVVAMERRVVEEDGGHVAEGCLYFDVGHGLSEMRCKGKENKGKNEKCFTNRLFVENVEEGTW